jgi:hypothetical protein
MAGWIEVNDMVRSPHTAQLADQRQQKTLAAAAIPATAASVH